MTGITQEIEVPDSDVTVLHPRHCDYALVIPVINEGERIRKQLRTLFALKSPVDIIMADGGSTDGSLDPEFLKTVGCRALLVKRGPGKLGAQLRMAYAWALGEGYKGVVTVDGNGKDGLEAIESFVEKLKDGFDYVQGSRYVPGGRAVNTPMDRKIAGRLIHAPVLSLFGRRWYTDTTNGFRAYSARYLLDPRVAPFRHVFSQYELLFYLTVRAGQLGYRVVEIPVERRYPKGEKTPTKISGFGGRIQMLGQLFAAALGRLNPG
ncbi:glycosyltransferase family 2 protein [Bradyrhizobium diazoefficiens]|nr:glycosyltransferase family 2 protein [Bradyrhizobium diazoefficiens]MBR0814677.1 glycosyltransferase family 2 protein [Bradyrhizobium diazoefficiens]